MLALTSDLFTHKNGLQCCRLIFFGNATGDILTYQLTYSIKTLSDSTAPKEGNVGC